MGAQDLNMPHTLRRKMFKLGGDVSKSHGVGLTSGLKFNKGGQVVQPGPDGQLRQHANIGGVMNFALMGIPKAIQALKFMRSTPGGSNLVSKYGLEGAKKFANEAQKVRSTKIGMPGTTMLGGNMQQAAMLANRTKNINPLRAGFGITRAVAPGAVTTGLAGTGAAFALGDRTGLTEKGNDDSRLESLARGAGKIGLDYLSIPGQATMAYQYLTGSKNDPKETSLTKLISGKDTSNPIAKATPKEQIDSEKEAMDKMQTEANKKVEQYYQMLGGGRKTSMMDVSKMLLAAAPLVAEGDYAGGMKAAGDVAIENVEMDQKIGQEAALMTIKELQQTDLMREEGINKLIAAGEIDSAKEGKRLFSAAEQTGGIENMPQDLPMKGNKEDDDLIQANTVYVDLKNYSGKLFVAYDGSKQPFPTSDYQAALSIAKA